MANILAVDDDFVVLEVVLQTLTAQGHAVDTAVNGADGLKLATKKAYDLLIIDRHMPVMSGIEAIQALRANPKLKSLKILMLTSASVTKEIDEAYAAGANGYILKPLKVDMFLGAVKKVLAPPTSGS